MLRVLVQVCTEQKGRHCCWCCWSSVGEDYTEEVTFRPSPKGLADFHLVQLGDRVVKSRDVATHGASRMTSDTAPGPAILEPKLSGTSQGEGAWWLPG